MIRLYYLLLIPPIIVMILFIIFCIHTGFWIVALPSAIVAFFLQRLEKK